MDYYNGYFGTGYSMLVRVVHSVELCWLALPYIVCYAVAIDPDQLLLHSNSPTPSHVLCYYFFFVLSCRINSLDISTKTIDLCLFHTRTVFIFIQFFKKKLFFLVVFNQDRNIELESICTVLLQSQQKEEKEHSYKLTFHLASTNEDRNNNNQMWR